MEKQGLKEANRNWIRGHIFWWAVYAVLVFATMQITALPDFADWSSPLRMATALAPALPVAIWLYIAGRFVARSPDELSVQNQLKATASAGVVTVLCLFAGGWVEAVLNVPPLSPWFYVAIFGIIWTVQLARFVMLSR